mmetsp:Transcript_46687/g.150493  ORF Transcript_46687/g.150493 Transcript_46687/m.150493 type:complete len:131 (-) Transcript_46687:94-486(-)
MAPSRPPPPPPPPTAAPPPISFDRPALVKAGNSVAAVLAAVPISPRFAARAVIDALAKARGAPEVVPARAAEARPWERAAALALFPDAELAAYVADGRARLGIQAGGDGEDDLARRARLLLADPAGLQAA